MINVYSRRDFLRYAGLGVAALMLPSELFSAEKRKPNIILILADDLGYADLGCQGCKDVPTPNIDRIAKNGMRFTDAHVSCPVCSPSRAGILTGRYQERFGHDGNPSADMDRKNWGLPLDQKTSANYMKELGYVTAAIGKWHLGDNAEFHPNKRGFDEFFGFIGGAHPYLNPTIDSWNTIQRNGTPVDEKDHISYAFGREATAFVERNKDKPFFLYLAFNAPHQPLEGARRDADAFPEIKDEKRRNFAKLMKSMDVSIGWVLDKVRESGIEQDTLIFFLSDNGGPTPGNTSRNDPYKGYKTQVHEGGTRIPFLVQWKGKLPAGKVYDKSLISLDILPTMVTAAGGKVAKNVEGVDLMPFLTGKKSGAPNSEMFWRFDKQLSVRKGDWKMSKHEDKGVRLYNLVEDPSEKNDLSAKYPEKVKELQNAWDKWNARNDKPKWPIRKDAPWIDSEW